MITDHVKAPDVVTTEDFHDARALLLYQSPRVDRGEWEDPEDQRPYSLHLCDALGKRWRTKAAQHLLEKLDRTFRDNLLPTTAEQAVSFGREVVGHLKQASQDLQTAAQRLNRAGDAYGARTTYEAHLRTKGAAESLLGAEE